MKIKVLVLGYFGYANHQLDGQTVKTRNVYDLLKTREDEIGTISYFDTQQFQQSKLSVLKMFSAVLKCDKLIYLPAHSNLKYIFPFLFVLSRLKRIDIVYIVIGGWLAEYLQTKGLHIRMLSKVKAILTESEQLSKKLAVRYQFQNAETFPNFRLHNFVPTFQKKPKSFKIVFMARIFREKGVDTVFRLADHLQKAYGDGHPFVIDFYGPIQNDEKEYFLNELQKFDFTKYKGILEPERIYSTLEQYDILVFPSRFSDEGFPGTLMDAYISGLPVITSNWRFLPEYVDHGCSGYLFDLDKENDFYAYVEQLYRDNDQLMKMKHCAFAKSKAYSSESAWKILKRHLTT